MGDDLDLDFEEVRRVVPAKRGDAILFANTVAHRSLPNHSDGVRWSIDLRFHSVLPDNGGVTDLDWFYGVKDSLQLKESDEGEPTNFADWAGQDRTKLQDASANKFADSELDPIIIGPWMDLWDVTKRNRHMDEYLRTLPSSKQEL